MLTTRQLFIGHDAAFREPICRFGSKLAPFVGLTLLPKICVLTHALQVVSVGHCPYIPTMLLIVEVPRKEILKRGADKDAEEGEY
jgi:hypothetical protein